MKCFIVSDTKLTISCAEFGFNYLVSSEQGMMVKPSNLFCVNSYGLSSLTEQAGPWRHRDHFVFSRYDHPYCFFWLFPENSPKCLGHAHCKSAALVPNANIAQFLTSFSTWGPLVSLDITRLVFEPSHSLEKYHPFIPSYSPDKRQSPRTLQRFPEYILLSLDTYST